MSDAAFIVVRLDDGKPAGYLHSVRADGRRHLVCTSAVGALRFPTRKAAADAAGDCMDRRPGEEYSAIPDQL